MSTAPLKQYPAAPPGLERLEPTVARAVSNALASYRLPTASRARLLAHLNRIEAEIDAALAIAKGVSPPALLRRLGDIRRAQQQGGHRAN